MKLFPTASKIAIRSVVIVLNPSGRSTANGTMLVNGVLDVFNIDLEESEKLAFERLLLDLDERAD